ncbi:MAG: Maf family nucleotide pyrophosphatase [Bacteroidota bacterium]|nr:Maf family nucleotide pyrophosphatase [Bacteroidota bacterium]
MPLSPLKKYDVILASNSPRRQELLKKLIPKFKIQVVPIEENYPKELAKDQIAKYLSELKSAAYQPTKNELIITADTIVSIGNEVLGKPKDSNDALEMLMKLSGKSHLVTTAVSIKTTEKLITFSDTTEVTFYKLTTQEMDQYVRNCQPFDKAGSYGIQEWMGYFGIKKINGDYFNVMGLPLHKLYRALKKL